MHFMQLSAVLVALFATAYGYSCPNDGHTFFHAEVSTGCQVYHRCENGQLSTLHCPSGQAFDHHTSQCVDASTVHCFETDSHHRHKRSDVQVHTISIETLKKNIKELVKSIVNLIREFLQEVAPTVLANLEAQYAPILKSIRDDFRPIFHDKIQPRLVKYLEYCKRVAGRVFQKLHQSYQQSNSTHINLVSFSDLASDLSKDMQPVLQLGRYFSSRLATQTRHKRSSTLYSNVNEFPELMLPMLEPYFATFANNIRKVVDGEENSVLSKVIIPVVKEMLADEKALFDLKRIYWSFKAAVFPFIHEMLERQSYYTPEGTVIKINTARYEATKAQFLRESKPIISDLWHTYGSKLLFQASDHTDLLLDTLRDLLPAYGNHAGVLSDLMTRFVLKHKGLFKKAGETYDSHTSSEIMKDLKPIAITVLQIVSDYMSTVENSWYSDFFNKNSFIGEILTANRPSYAQPSGNGYGGRPSNTVKSYVTNNRVYRSNRRG